MELRFQNKDLRAFDASILDGASAPTASAPTASARGGGAARKRPTTEVPNVAKSVGMLDLSHNSIASISNFHLLTRLTVLDLTHNSLTTLTPNTEGRSAGNGVPFVFPKSLARLDLSYNSIRSAAALASLPNLTWLNLSYQGTTNQSFFDASTLEFLPSESLVTLDVSGLALSSTKPIAHLSNLTRLNVSNNNLSTIGDGLSPLKGMRWTLEHLTLVGNPIFPSASSPLHHASATASGASVPTGVAAVLFGVDEKQNDAGPSFSDGLFPMLRTLNGNPVESIGAYVRKSAANSRQQSANTSRIASGCNSANTSVIPTTDGYVKRSRQQQQRVHSASETVFTMRQLEQEDTTRRSAHASPTRFPTAPTSADFAPEFGTVSDQSVLHNVSRRSAHQNVRPTVRVTLDVEGIRLQEMERMLAELTAKEASLKKTVRTQQLSVAANNKVAQEQRLKLEALVELEEELTLESCRLNAQLQELNAAKMDHDETLLISRIAYAV